MYPCAFPRMDCIQWHISERPMVGLWESHGMWLGFLGWVPQNAMDWFQPHCCKKIRPTPWANQRKTCVFSSGIPCTKLLIMTLPNWEFNNISGHSLFWGHPHIVKCTIHLPIFIGIREVHSLEMMVIYTKKQSWQNKSSILGFLEVCHMCCLRCWKKLRPSWQQMLEYINESIKLLKGHSLSSLAGAVSGLMILLANCGTLDKLVSNLTNGWIYGG